MTGAQLNTLINSKCRTNDTTFTQAEKLVLVNLFKDELAGRIQQVRPEVWNMPALDDLVLNQREYAFATDLMNRMVGLELKFTASGDYVLCDPIQRSHYLDTLQESVIVANYDNLDPKYFIRRGAIYILSAAIIAVTNGIRFIYDVFPADLANLTGSTDLSLDPSTTSRGFPREFHEILARRVSMEYKDRMGIKLSVMEMNYENDLQKLLDNFAGGNLDEEITGKLPDDSDVDNGFDL